MVLQDSNSFDAEAFLQANNLADNTPLCIIGTSSADTITGGSGKDVIFGLDGKPLNGGLRSQSCSCNTYILFKECIYLHLHIFEKVL